VLLAQFTAPDRAANIPEFLHAGAGAIRRIREKFVDDSYYARSGDVSRFQGDHEIALRDFQKALELNPKNIEAHVGMGASLTHLGRVQEAKVHLERAIEIRPQSAEAHEALGNLLARQGKFPEAAACFREAIRLDPSLAVAHFRLGTVLLDLGPIDEAKRHLAEAVRLEPGDPKAICSLGAALLREGSPDQAAAYYRRALALDPKLLAALTDLASLLATSGDPNLRNGKQAVELATRACELTRHQDPSIQLILSEAYAEAGRLGDAVFVAERVLQMASARGEQRLIDSARRHLESYRQGAPFRRSRQP
jgi:Flp pilus assembly protein TadD